MRLIGVISESNGGREMLRSGNLQKLGPKFRSFPRCAALWTCATIFWIVCQISTNAQIDAKKPLPFYDLVSIHQNHTDSDVTSVWRKTADGVRGINVPLVALIWSAYEIKNPDMIVGVPKWAKFSLYDLEAKMDEENLARWRQLPDSEKPGAERVMLQTVLSDRFHLKCHDEKREIAVYSLVVDKSGFKLKPKSQADPGSTESIENGIVFHSFQMDDLALTLSADAGRTIEDHTGITGHYDFTLRWSSGDDSSANDSEPSLFKALQEQLGLKLVPTKATEKVLVIDSLERPTEN